MEFIETSLNDVLIIKPRIFQDERGLFFESFNKDTFQRSGTESNFVQDNQSFSVKGVLRGLHFQTGQFAQGKLVRVLMGRVLDVALDLRPDSTSFGKYEIFDLDSLTGTMVYIPPGFAHGFLAVEDSIFHYKCTKGYNKDAECGILWNDPYLQIPWNIESPIVSQKDRELLSFDQFFKNQIQVV